MRQATALRSVVLLVLVMMLASSIPIQKSSAVDTVVLSVSSQGQTVAAGEVFNVTIMVDIPSTPGAVGIQFIIMWDPTIIEGISMTEELFHSLTPEDEWSNIAMYLNQVNSTGGYAQYAYTFYDVLGALNTGYAPFTGSHKLATITLNGSSTGYSALHFTYIVSGGVSEGGVVDLPSSGIDGSVIVGNPLPIITVLSPQDGGYSKIPVNLTAIVSKGVSWMGYSLDEQANVTFTNDLIQVSEGEHNIVVYANDSSGQMVSSNIVHFIADSTPPVVSLAVSPSSSDAAAKLVFGVHRWKYNFTAAGSHDTLSNISSYFWDFGDGSNATSVEVSHEYRTPGTYNVVLRVTDGAGNSATDATAININSVSELIIPLGFVAAIIIPAVWICALVFYLMRTRKGKKA